MLAVHLEVNICDLSKFVSFSNIISSVLPHYFFYNKGHKFNLLADGWGGGSVGNIFATRGTKLRSTESLKSQVTCL